MTVLAFASHKHTHTPKVQIQSQLFIFSYKFWNQGIFLYQFTPCTTQTLPLLAAHPLEVPTLTSRSSGWTLFWFTLGFCLLFKKHHLHVLTLMVTHDVYCVLDCSKHLFICKLICPQNTVRKCESLYSEEALQRVGIVPKVTQLSQWWREGVKRVIWPQSPHSEPLFCIIWLGVLFFKGFYHKITKLWGVGFLWSFHGVINSQLQSHMMMQIWDSCLDSLVSSWEGLLDGSPSFTIY